MTDLPERSGPLEAVGLSESRERVVQELPFEAYLAFGTELEGDWYVGFHEHAVQPNATSAAER